jgi:hypothetical protein
LDELLKLDCGRRKAFILKSVVHHGSKLDSEVNLQPRYPREHPRKYVVDMVIKQCRGVVASHGTAKALEQANTDWKGSFRPTSRIFHDHAGRV